MIDNGFIATDGQEKVKNKNRYLVVLLPILVIVVIVALVIFYWGKSGTKEAINDTPPNVIETPAAMLIPKDTKSSEDFLDKVQGKSAAMQKNYDNNLTEFASKRWEKLFREQNVVNPSDSGNSLNIISQEIQKTDDQSTLFKVKYRVKKGETELVMEDFYYLILSEAKRIELGLDKLKSNVFLSEEDIKNNLTRENFVKIGKIQ